MIYDHHRSSWRRLHLVRKCEVTFVSSSSPSRPTQQSGNEDACPANEVDYYMPTPARTLLHTCTTISVSSYHIHLNPQLQPSLNLQSLLEASRLASPALINSIVALFNCTADFSGTTLRTTQDDSDRVRGPHFPGPLLRQPASPACH